ncbi:ArnT family glycosyltransferase [Pseudomonas tructae]|nr:hypothetical protein [Pseudomonas tructae]
MISYISRMVSTYPVRLAFAGSLLLSLVAVLGVATVGRDAALYLDIARQVSEQGPKVAWNAFDWPWFTLLLAGTHSLFGLSLELSAYLWCALFMAGTCALLVDCVRQRVPQAAGWACLLVLAMPAVNQFRNDIIREFGFWFFCVLALWLVQHWQARGGWLRAACIHLAIGAAALFRLEALMLLPALGLWQLIGLRDRQSWQRFCQFLVLPLLAGVLALAVLLVQGGISSARLENYLGLINPQRVLGAFKILSQQFADSLTYKFSKDEAGRIVFFGLLAAMLIKFVTLMGPFSLPFLHRSSWQALRTYGREYQPFAWVAGLYLIILMVFFVVQQFMNSRYLSFLNLLVLPLLAIALMQFARNFPRLGKVLVAIALLVMLANVISTGARKTQYVDAGHWIAANIDPQAATYFEDGRISYYAGRGYFGVLPREEALSDEHVSTYRYFAIEARADEPWLAAWLEKHQLKVLSSFANRKGATVLVIGK